MFEPGHLRICRVALQPTDVGYDIHIHYEVSQDPAQGTCMLFRMQGQVNGKAFEEQFLLPKDMAFNFAHDANRIALKNGLPHNASLPLAMHKDYDAMFEDVRAKLHAQSGEPVKPEHLV